MKGLIVVNQSIGHNQYKIDRFLEEGKKLGIDLNVVVNDGTLSKIENGEIVLTECPDKDTDSDCHYTIKKYQSERQQNEDGTIVHTKIVLIPLNKDYDAIELDGETEYRTIGILKCVLSK